MADWGGFTEEDLRQLSYPLPRSDSALSERNLNVSAKKQANFGKQRNKNPKDRVMTSPKKRVTLSDVVQVMPVDEMLSPASMFNGENGVPGTKEGPNANKPKGPQTPPKSVLKNSKSAERSKLQNSYNAETSSVNEPSQGSPLHEIPPEEGCAAQKEMACRELDEKEALSRELTQIEKFQHQQKLIEERNKQTRNFLAEAIKDRWEKAETEAVLLTKLQKELSRLDDLLTADVSIIRDKIETSSLDYLEAQKRYEKAEKEFIRCKLEMFRKAELKEQLTEHLYTIIYQNEMRKAQKLSELMEKLKICPMSEEVECILPPMPPVPVYNPVNTIHSPYKDISITTTTTTTIDTTTTTTSNVNSTDTEPTIITESRPEKDPPLTTPAATTLSQSEDSHTAEASTDACPSEGTKSTPELSGSSSGDQLHQKLSESRVGAGDDASAVVSNPVVNSPSNISNAGNNNNNNSSSSNNNNINDNNNNNNNNSNNNNNNNITVPASPTQRKSDNAKGDNHDKGEGTGDS